jgi:ribonuclease HI
MTKLPTFELFTDGACLGNPGPGGWAYILRDSSCNEVVGSGGDKETTNQRMEVTAVLRALESLSEPSFVKIHADSEYVTKTLSGRLDNWISRGWKTASKKPVANQHLWKPLADLLKIHQVTTNWVKGHAGHPENERCDTIASAEADKFL